MCKIDPPGSILGLDYKKRETHPRADQSRTRWWVWGGSVVASPYQNRLGSVGVVLGLYAVTHFADAY